MNKPTGAKIGYVHNPLTGKVSIKDYEHLGGFGDNFSARRAYNRERENEVKRHKERQEMKEV
jgi:hypothetical protein